MDIQTQIQFGILGLVEWLHVNLYTLRDNYGEFNNMQQMWYIAISL